MVKIGLGSASSGIARTSLLLALQGLGAEVVAGSATKQDAARQALDQHGYTTAKVYPDFATMVRDADFDTAIVGGANGTHAQQAELALLAGKDVLVEKPLALTVAELGRLLLVAARSGKRLGGIVQKCGTPQFRLVHAAALSGLFGSEPLIEAELPWFRGKDDYYYSTSGAPTGWKGTELDGSVLHNQGYHHGDMEMRLASAVECLDEAIGVNPLVSVSATGETRLHTEIAFPDTVEVEARLRSGGQLKLRVTTAEPKEGLDWLRISGQGNEAKITSDALTVWQFEKSTRFDAEAAQHLGQKATVHTAADPLSGLGHGAHQRVLDAFLANKDPWLWHPVRHGMALTLIDAAIESIGQQGKEVKPADLSEFAA